MVQKKKWPMILMLCLCGILAAAGGGSAVYSFLSADSESSVNSFTPGYVETKIEESVPEGQTVSVGSTSEKSYVKKVAVKNTGANACYVRVLALFSNEDFGASFSLINIRGWEKDGDYYYCKKALQPGETSTALFAGFSVPGAAAEGSTEGKRTRFLEETETLDVIVYQEAVSTFGDGRVFEDYREAWDFYTTGRQD